MSNRPASFVNAVLNGLVTAFAFSALPDSPNGIGVGLIAGNHFAGNIVRQSASTFGKLFNNSFNNVGALPSSFVGFLVGSVGSYIMDHVYELATGKPAEDQQSNFTSFVQTALVGVVTAPFIISLVALRQPPFNPQGNGVKYAFVTTAAKMATQGLYQQLIYEEAVGGP